jgi:hypothetical protein
MPCDRVPAAIVARRALQRRRGAAAGWSIERWRLAQQDDAASLDWPQHPTCGTNLRCLGGRVDGGDNPQRLVLVHHLEWKQTLYVASGLPACAAGEQTNKRPIAQANKRRHRGRRRPGRWLCRGMGSPRCEGFRAARSALREEEGLRRGFLWQCHGRPLCVCVCRASARTCVCACVRACAFVCCWGRVGGRGCFLPQTVRSDDRHRVLRIELHSRVRLARARTKTRARARTAQAHLFDLDVGVVYETDLRRTVARAAAAERVEPPTNEQTLPKCFRDSERRFESHSGGTMTGPRRPIRQRAAYGEAFAARRSAAMAEAEAQLLGMTPRQPHRTRRTRSAARRGVALGDLPHEVVAERARHVQPADLSATGLALNGQKRTAVRLRRVRHSPVCHSRPPHWRRLAMRSAHSTARFRAVAAKRREAPRVAEGRRGSPRVAEGSRGWPRVAEGSRG